MSIKIKQMFAYVLVASFIVSGVFSASLQAAMISSQQVQQQYDKGQLLDNLAKVEVQEKLVALGVDVDLVKERVQHLSSEELAQLNAQLDQLPAGSGVVGVLVLLFVIFVITDMLGATNIFSFVKPIQ